MLYISKLLEILLPLVQVALITLVLLAGFAICAVLMGRIFEKMGL